MRDWSPWLGLPLWFWLFVLPISIGLLCLFAPKLMSPVLTPLGRITDRIYKAFGALAALFLVAILGIIVAQMVARWTGVKFSGSTNFAGYMMAGASFFAFAYALTKGAHIRVSIFLNMNRHTRFWLDAAAMMIAAVIATYFARYAIKTAIFSELLNDRTQGQDQVPEWLTAAVSLLWTVPTEWGEVMANAGDGWEFTPLWLPQLTMAVGTVLLAVALWDYWFRLLMNRTTAIVSEGVE